jgi:hypothetical protein
MNPLEGGAVEGGEGWEGTESEGSGDEYRPSLCKCEWELCEVTL